MAKRGNKPKPPPESYDPQVVARRERELEQIGGIPLTYLKKEGVRVVERQTALTNFAGFTLGQLFLKWQANPKDRMGITEEEYQAGEKWASLVRLHSRIMDYELKRNVASPQWISISKGISTREEPEEEEILRVRHKFRMCYDDLVATGWATADLVYSVCIDNLPYVNLDERKVQVLRRGLRALHERLC